MALKFLNKKGWHTGSLRNIENVWKAEQKHDAEQKKLEELRKQIQEERERSEFRLLQEQAGLVPKQERLDFLYDSGLAVGKGSSDGFKTLEALPKTDTETGSSSSAKQASVPGALFEEKPQSANDAWRKLHSDPLLLIRKREQEALVRVKNNPIQMAMIRKSVEAKKHTEKTIDRKELQKKLHHNKSKHQKHSSSKHQFDSENDGEERKADNHKRSKHDEHFYKARPGSGDGSGERESRSKKNCDNDLKYKDHPPTGPSDPKMAKIEGQDRIKRNHDESKREKYSLEGRTDSKAVRKERENRSFCQASCYDSSARVPRPESHHKRRIITPKLSDEERAARLQEMQVDAELHEEQRWKRLRNAENDDAQEATRAGIFSGRNFLDAAQKNVYGAEEGGSFTIEESVRRRTHYLQGRSEASEGNAFRR